MALCDLGGDEKIASVEVTKDDKIGQFGRIHANKEGTVLVPCGEESAGAYAKFAARVCDESVGVGADGFIIVRTEPVLEMVFFNRDGSRAPMCGNGIRCFAHYCREIGRASCRERVYHCV